MRDIDRQTYTALGISEYALMCRAGEAAFQLLVSRWPKARRILVLCGTGDNGGDGWVVVRLAHNARLDCRVALFGDPARIVGAARMAYDAWRESNRGAPVNAQTLNVGDLEIGACDIVIDALTGIGLSGPARADFVELIALVNGSPVPVLSLDVPSGVDADTGSVIGSAIQATTTMAFIAHKPGLLTGAALNHVGQLVLADLGAPPPVFQSVPADGYRISADAAGGLAARSTTAHKGHFGLSLIHI